MGFFKKLFNDIGDAIKNNVEERKQEIRQNIEDRKQQFYESIEERKKEVLSKLGVISEETDQQSASIYDVVTTSDDNNRKIDGSIVEETAKNKQEQEHEESMKEDNYPEVRNECKSEILSNPSAEEGKLHINCPIIPEDAFNGAPLKEVIFGEGVKKIESLAFANCEKLKSITLPHSIIEIGAFSGWGLGAFQCCKKLKKVDLSQCENLESIGPYTFGNCTSLSEIDFSSCVSLKEFGGDALSDCPVRIIDFSKCISLDLHWLTKTKNLEKVILPPGQKSFNAICIWDQFGYNIDKSLCHFQHIKKEAFSKMEITEIEIPDTVEEIELNAFEGCEQLKTIVLPASLKKMDSLGWGLERLKKLDFSKVTQLKKIPENVVSGCPKLRELTIPNGVVEIEDDAFSEASNLRTLFLPPTLEEIGELGLKKLDIYCFSPAIEELTPLVVAIFDNEEEDEEEDDEEKKKIDPKSYRINLFVLPQYLEKYIAQRNAERIAKDVLVIQAIPDEYLYYYDK